MAKKKVQRRASALSIPRQKNVPPPNIDAYSWFIYGEKGIGKSTLAAQFPDTTAHFMWEARRYDIKSPIIPQQGEQRLSWPRYQEYLKLLNADEKPGRIVLDTIDRAAKACEDYHARRKGVASLLGLHDHGRSWDEMKTDWINTHSDLIFNGWRFTFLSHARHRPRDVKGVSRENTKELVEEGVIGYQRQPTSRPWSVQWTYEPAAYIAYYGWDGDDRVLYIRGGNTTLCSVANSEEHFIQPKGKDSAGEPYELLFMGTSPQEAYGNLCLGWQNKCEGYFMNSDE